MAWSLLDRIVYDDGTYAIGVNYTLRVDDEFPLHVEADGSLHISDQIGFTRP